MRFTLAAIVACAVIGNVQAGLPSLDSVFQLQPTFRGPFPRTPCVTVFTGANNGSAALINDCTTATQQRAFQITQLPGTLGQIRIFNTFCLQALEANNGAKVTISSCVDGDARQQWLWNTNGVIQWGQFFEMCLDLTDGVLTNGNQLQIWECAFVTNGGNNPNQIWSANTLSNPLQEVTLSNTGVCVGARSSDNGSPVFGVSCLDTTARKVWAVPQPGHGNIGSLQVAFGTDGGAPVKCLDVTDGVVANGTKLQLWDCTGGPNQSFFPTGAEFRWDATSLLNALCIDLTDGVEGNQLQIWSCIGGPNQNQQFFGVPPAQLDI